MKSDGRRFIDADITIENRPFPYDAGAALNRVQTLGRKFDFGDLDDNLRHFAIDWLWSLPKPINFAFLRDLRETVESGTDTLTGPQYAGILNCARSALMRTPQTKKTVTVTEGIYKEPDGPIFKVQKGRGSGRLYTKELKVLKEPVVERDDEGYMQTVEPAIVRFVYAPSAVFNLTPEMRLTKEEAKAFGAWSGTCISCGRHLTADDSIDRMMGPVCFKRQF